MNSSDKMPATGPDTAGPADLKQGGGDPAATLPERDGLDPGGAGDLTGIGGDAPRDPRAVGERSLAGGAERPSSLGEAIGTGAGAADAGSGTPADTAGAGGGGAEGGVGQR
ncbi:hypothetical protein GGR88_002166 [Sphingomonas jejuensis]|uniref:Uncharacterized protein n=1 Tax=Sphingomonas jejuensis TaxID=904715 RepID=A0ABX0XPK1_9SPHN|nr:hypothetical protein [Sphingomonas jejuensis]NJC34652.1 hypothetical protein [Sphingomonas jejuensis]